VRDNAIYLDGRQKFSGQAIQQVLAHEIGHVLGVNVFRVVSLCICLVAGLLQACDAEPEFGGVGPGEAFADRPASQLASAACRGDVETVRKLLDAGVSANSLGRNGTTPLFWAVACRSAPGVVALLEGGADPNRVADDDFSPAWLAAEHGEIAMVGPILDAGGDPNARDSTGRTALMMAVAAQHEDPVWALVQAGADINAADDPKSPTPLTAPMYAITFGKFSLAEKFLDAGYSYRLDDFAWWVAGRAALTESERLAKESLLAALDRRGVYIPTEDDVALGLNDWKKMHER